MNTYKLQFSLFCLIIWVTVIPCKTEAWGNSMILSRGKTYSLPDLYRIALKQSEAIKISEADLYIAEAGKDKARAALRPGLSGVGNLIKYSEKKKVAGAIIQPDWGASYGLKLSQTITLNGKERLNFEAAEKNVRKREYDLYAVKETYIFNVAQAYYDVLKAMKGVEIAAANAERLEKHREAVSIRLEIQEVAKTALYRAEAELSQAKTDLISAKNYLKLSKAILARAAGLSDRVYNIRGPGVIETFFPGGNLKDLKTEGAENRAELKALRIQEQIAETNVEIAGSDYYPTLTAEGTYMSFQQSPSSEGMNEESISLGLTLTMPLYDNGLRMASVAEAFAQKRQTSLAVENLSKQIAIEIEQVYLELMTHQSTLKSLKDQLDFARENYQAVSKQFKYGLANSIDVMDANTLLVTSHRQLAESRYSFQLAILKMERAKGTFLKGITEVVGEQEPAR